MVDPSEFNQLALDKIPIILEEIRDSFKEHCQKVDQLPAEIQFLYRAAVAAEWDYVECVPIGVSDGIANYLYRITVGDQSVVVKWSREIYKIEELYDIGLPKLDAQVMKHRNEHDWLGINTINKYVPSAMPEVYWTDVGRHFFIMEYLQDYVTLKDQLAQGFVNREVFIEVATFLGSLHRRTHKKTLPSEEFDKLYQQFNIRFASLNQALFSWLTEDTFRSDSINAKLRRRTSALDKVLPELIDNPQIQEAMKAVKRSCLDIHQCLLHNDSHPGFAMVNGGSNKVKYIDADLCLVGNPYKEVGYFLGEVIVWYYVNLGHRRHDACKQIIKCAREFVGIYRGIMDTLIEDNKTFFYYVALHAGHLNGIRTANLVPFPQFDNLEAEEAQCVRVVSNLLKQADEITDIDRFIEIAFDTESL